MIIGERAADLIQPKRRRPYPQGQPWSAPRADSAKSLRPLPSGRAGLRLNVTPQAWHVCQLAHRR